MGIDTMDSLEYDTGPREGGSEGVSEADRVRISRTIANIQKTQKDEKRSRRDDDHLVDILKILLQDERYHPLLDNLIPVIDLGISSAYVIAILSLVCVEAEMTILRYYYPQGHIAQSRVLTRRYAMPDQVKDFDDLSLDVSIRTRINEWIADILHTLAYDPSQILLARAVSMLDQGKGSQGIVRCTADVFRFFLGSLRLRISQARAEAYAGFIL